MIIQCVVELISDLIYNVSITVFDAGSDRAHVSFAGDTDVARFHCKSEHSVVSGAVDIAGILEVIDRSLHPAASKGGRTVSEPVVVGKGGIHFFDKSGRVAGVSAVVVELVYVSAQIDPAVHQLSLNFTLNITAGEVGDCSGSDFCHKGVVVDIFRVIVAARVCAAPEDFHCRVSDFKRGALFQINDLAAVIIGSIDNIVIAVQKILAIAGGLGPAFHVIRVRKVYCAHMKPGIINNIGYLIHMIVMIVGEIDVESIEMMVIEIIHQCIVLISDISVHQKILAAAAEHRTVAPDSGISEIDGSDLHLSACRLGRNYRCDGRQDHHSCKNDHKERTPDR